MATRAAQKTSPLARRTAGENHLGQGPGGSSRPEPRARHAREPRRGSCMSRTNRRKTPVMKSEAGSTPELFHASSLISLAPRRARSTRPGRHCNRVTRLDGASGAGLSPVGSGGETRLVGVPAGALGISIARVFFCRDDASPFVTRPGLRREETFRRVDRRRCIVSFRHSSFARRLLLSFLPLRTALCRFNIESCLFSYRTLFAYRMSAHPEAGGVSRVGRLPLRRSSRRSCKMNWDNVSGRVS